MTATSVQHMWLPQAGLESVCYILALRGCINDCCPTLLVACTAPILSAPVAYRGRDEAKGRAAEHLRLGNSQAAYECFQKAVDISPEVANRFVQVSFGDDCAGSCCAHSSVMRADLQPEAV